MNTLNYTTLRKNLAAAIDSVIDDHNPLLITKGSDKAVVMMSLDDWNAWQETIYLLQNPSNAERLLESIADFDKGQNTIRKEIDLE